MRKILGIICHQEIYMHRLADTLCREQFREWQAACFTSLSDFFRWEGSADAALMLIDEAFREEWYQADYQKEGSIVCAWLRDENDVDEDENDIFMYQPAEQIAECLMACYLRGSAGRRSREKGGNLWKPPPEGLHLPENQEEAKAQEQVYVYGVCSPCGGVGATGLAWNLAKELSKKGTTLFLSLDPYPGLPEPLRLSQGTSELLYLLKEYKEGWTAQREYAIVRVGQLEAVAGMADGIDLWQWDMEEWNYLLYGLSQEKYRYLVVDFGKICSSRENLVGTCNRVIIVGEKNDPKVIRWKQQYKKDSIQTVTEMAPHGFANWEKEQILGLLPSAEG